MSLDSNFPCDFDPKVEQVCEEQHGTSSWSTSSSELMSSYEGKVMLFDSFKRACFTLGFYKICSNPNIYPANTATNPQLWLWSEKLFFFSHHETPPLSPPRDFDLVSPMGKQLKVGALISDTTTRQAFCFSDEVAFLSHSEQSWMYWSSGGVVTFGFPKCALGSSWSSLHRVS